MILLFNKVYLKVDHLVKGERERVVISQTYGRSSAIASPAPASLTSAAPAVGALAQATTVQELIDAQFDGNPTRFIQALLQFPAERRLTIYCDAEAMFTLVTKFWKTLMPALTPDAFYRLLNFSFSQLVEVVGTGYTAFTILPELRAKTVRADYAWFLQDQNKATVLQAWTDTIPFVITRTQREVLIKNAALELQLASMLSVPNWRYTNVVKAKVVRMIFKEAIHEYNHDVKSHVLTGLVNFKYYEPDTTFDFFKHTIDELVAMHPQYAFLTDDRFVPDDVNRIRATYDFDQLRAIRTALHEDEYQYGIDWAPLLKNDLSFEDIIAYEVSTPVTKLFLNRSTYQESVNPYMVDYILNAVRRNDMAALTPYSLG
jgi:hypothetical protein